MFQYSICDTHFGIKKAELTSGIAVRVLKVFIDILFFYDSAGR